MYKVVVISSLLPLITAFCCHSPSSFDAKLKLINHNHDHNNDSHVSLSDIRYDLNHHFDKNKDGKVDKVEFAVSWNCMYGDSFEYALWLFAQNDRNHDNFIEVSDAAKGPIGHSPMTLAAFETLNRQVCLLKYNRYGLLRFRRFSCFEIYRQSLYSCRSLHEVCISCWLPVYGNFRFWLLIAL